MREKRKKTREKIENNKNVQQNFEKIKRDKNKIPNNKMFSRILRIKRKKEKEKSEVMEGKTPIYNVTTRAKNKQTQKRGSIFGEGQVIVEFS